MFIRDVPVEIHDWINEEKHRSLLTKNELVLEILEQAYRGSRQMPLLARSDGSTWCRGRCRSASLTFLLGSAA